MATLFAKHRQKLTATAVATGQPLDTRTQNQYNLLQAKLGEDKRTLSNIQSIERKIDYKKKILPEYQAWIDSVLETGTGAEDPVFMHLLVWQIDAENYAQALPMAAYAIKHKLPLPQQYTRTLGTLIAEEFADAKTIDSASLIAVDDLTQSEDMPDQVRAKIKKAIGLSLAPTDVKNALFYLTRADELNAKVGVKKKIEELKKQLQDTAK